MYWRWQNPEGRQSYRSYSTQEEAKGAAVCLGSKMSFSEWLKQPADKRAVLWKLLERAGWSIRYAP